MAKFEVCCHKFADLSDYGYGVSILNDSKYGFATCGNLMRLSLLRSPKAPDAHADMGSHKIRWAILPHKGQLGPMTVQAAFNFNNPLRLLCSTNGVRGKTIERHKHYPIRLTGDSSLVLDTVKRGEDDEDVSQGDFTVKPGRRVVLRVYESLGGRSRGTIHFDWNVANVFRSNSLEDEMDEVEFRHGMFKIDLKAFEVATYVLRLA